jgi:hypothetical protein
MSSYLIKHITGLTVPLCQIVSTNTIIRKGEIKMRIIPAETQCMIIDMQEKLVPAMFNKEACEDRVCMLARGLNLLEIPMLITQQYTKGLGGSLPSVYEAAGTKEFFDKRTFSCAQDENIVAALQKKNRKNVLICGTEAHVCVLQTCIDLKALGFQPILVIDAIASRKKSDLKAAIKRAMQEGVMITTAEAVLFELTVDSRHPKFRDISNVVK